MQLTSHTDYALRLLMYLMLYKEERVSVKHVASLYHISAHHLAKVASRLASLGWIQSHRGHGGGLAIMPGTDQLSVAEVVRALEPSLRIVECFGSPHACPLSPACKLKFALHQASQAFLTVLDDYPLYTLVEEPDLLRSLIDPQKSTDPSS